MIGKKIFKQDIDWDDYSTTAEWCNGNNAIIEDKGEYYEVVGIVLTFEQIKEKRLAELISTFDAVINGHFTTTEGYEMQFSEHDSNLLNGSITLMEKQGKTTGYLTQYNDETVYDVPLETMKNVLLQMLVRFAECHSKKQEYRTLINNAVSEDELNNIAFNFEQSNEGSSE